MATKLLLLRADRPRRGDDILFSSISGSAASARDVDGRLGGGVEVQAPSGGAR